jgi:hypothetical protein
MTKTARPPLRPNNRDIPCLAALHGLSADLLDRRTIGTAYVVPTLLLTSYRKQAEVVATENSHRLFDEKEELGTDCPKAH